MNRDNTSKCLYSEVELLAFFHRPKLDEPLRRENRAINLELI